MMMKVDVFCIASGPSLRAADCELVRQSGAKVIAVNNSWQIAPFCDYLYAGDSKWWRTYHKEIDVPAERWTCSRDASQKYGAKLHIAGGGYNSGMRAIQFAVMKGFKTIGLLGYDCSLKNGVHWHGLHDRPFLKNPSQVKVLRWREQFLRAAEKALIAGARVVNFSRYTELECFERGLLEDVVKRECADVH